MITFTTFKSGSSGNLYRLSNGNDTLMIEAGLTFPEIRQFFNFQVSQVAGCLISHEHSDHAKSAGKLIKAGVDVYMTVGTAEALKMSGHRVKIIEPGKQFNAGSFQAVPFKTEHDAADPVGFLIASGESKLLFATDTYFIRPQFKGLTHIAVECNYDLKILDRNVEAGRYPRSNRDRVRESHMSLDTCREFIRSQDLSRVREIWLLHLSDANSDAAMFKTEIEKLTGKPVHIA